MDKEILIENIISGYYSKHSRGEELLNIDLDDLLDVTTSKVKELAEELSSLDDVMYEKNGKIEDLEGEIEELEDRIEELEDELRDEI